jgi:hypothetical protein
MTAEVASTARAKDDAIAVDGDSQGLADRSRVVLDRHVLDCEIVCVEEEGGGPKSPDSLAIEPCHVCVQPVDEDCGRWVLTDNANEALGEPVPILARAS